MARTSVFQADEGGSKPLGATKFCIVSGRQLRLAVVGVTLRLMKGTVCSMKSVPNFWAPNMTAFHFPIVTVRGGTIVLQATADFRDME